MERTGRVVVALLVRSGGLILTGALAGCLPVRMDGYEPSGLGDQVSMARAGITCVLGDGEVLRTEAKSGVVIYTHAGRGYAYKGSITLVIRLVIPADVTVRLLSPDFTAESPQWEGTRTLTATPYPSEMRRTPDNYGVFSLGFDRALMAAMLPEVETFRVKFPLLAINSDTYQLPDVQFRATKRWAIAGLCQ